MCGVYLNRSRFISAVLYIPITFILAMTEEILIGVGQDAETAYQAERYLLAMLPAVFFMLQYEPLSRFMMA